MPHTRLGTPAARAVSARRREVRRDDDLALVRSAAACRCWGAGDDETETGEDRSRREPASLHEFLPLRYFVVRVPLRFPDAWRDPRLTVERRRRSSRRQSRAVPACDREGHRALLLRPPGVARRRALNLRSALRHRLVPSLAALPSYLYG